MIRRLEGGSDNPPLPPIFRCRQSSGTAVARFLLNGAAEFRSPHEFDAVGRRAPPTTHLLDRLLENDRLLDGWLARDCQMPELTYPRGPNYVEPGEVAAVGTAKARSTVGKEVGHGREATRPRR